MMGEPSGDDPPFMEKYKSLLDDQEAMVGQAAAEEERELPLIDLGELDSAEEAAREECKRKIAGASREWGFFQAFNHGISPEILGEMTAEQVKLFRKPFSQRTKDVEFNFSAGSYRWGTPSATNIRQLSWSEAFHVQLSDVSAPTACQTHLSSTMTKFAEGTRELAEKLCKILGEELGEKSNYFEQKCWSKSSYVRMNRYPPCGPNHVFGLIPHTDTDFLTILHQDQIGGLHLVKDDKWISVKPKPNTLVINIGDIFQAWSNGIYKSVEHRVIPNQTKERFSTAFFFCPSDDTLINGYSQPSIYKPFTFGEYKRQVQEDVKNLGQKLGLLRFLISPP